MRAFIPYYLAVGSICCVAAGLAGCATHSFSYEAAARADMVEYAPASLKHPFSGYEEVLKFVGKSEGVPQNKSALFEFAADSELQRFFYPEPIGELVAMRPDYHAIPGGLRGAQGQGRYYVFQVTERQWTLVGIFRGNRLRWECIGDNLRVFAHWHSSAFDDDADDSVYRWNGKYFEEPAA